MMTWESRELTTVRLCRTAMECHCSWRRRLLIWTKMLLSNLQGLCRNQRYLRARKWLLTTLLTGPIELGAPIAWPPDDPTPITYQRHLTRRGQHLCWSRTIVSSATTKMKRPQPCLLLASIHPALCSQPSSQQKELTQLLWLDLRTSSGTLDTQRLFTKATKSFLFVRSSRKPSGHPLDKASYSTISSLKWCLRLPQLVSHSPTAGPRMRSRKLRIWYGLTKLHWRAILGLAFLRTIH